MNTGASRSCSTGGCFLRDALMIVVRLWLGGLLLFAGYMKLGIVLFPDVTVAGITLPLSKPDDTLGMFTAIGTFQFGLPAGLQQFLAYAIPWTEVVVGAALVLGLWARSAALLATMLMLAFAGGAASLMIRGISAPCTCFGAMPVFCAKGDPIGWCHLIRDVVMGGMGVALMVCGPGYLAIDRLLGSGKPRAVAA